MATVGIDVGGTKCLAVVLDERGQVTAEHRVPTPRGGDDLLDAIASLAAGIGPGLPVGVGLAGLVDWDGVLRFAPNLPGLVNLPVRAPLSDRLGQPVVVAHDANAACVAELRLGAAVGATDAVVVAFGTGTGAGFVSGGRLVLGANGFAGEVGHMVVDPGGPECPCGKRGCWERYASGSGLGRMGREAAAAGRAPGVLARAGGDPAAVRGEHVSEACLAGDEGAAEVVRQFARWVALGLVNLTYLLDPQLFVLGGGLVEAGEVLFGPAREAFAELLAGAGYRPGVAVEPARLGEHAGAIGAALLARGEGAW